MTFFNKLQAKWGEGKFLCVGLDTDYEKIPLLAQLSTRENSVLEFNKTIIQATADFVCAFKPNIAFYEALGQGGFLVLRETVKYIREIDPALPVILDCKRGDIGNTNAGYITAAFDILNADAVTVSPYLGQEAMRPFLDRKDKGIFVLCRTSNSGAGEFQDLMVDNGTTGKASVPLYQVVAQQVARRWNMFANCGLVVGATYPEQLADVRKLVGDMPILIPGVGAQGGDLKKSVLAGLNSRKQGIIINASREVLYASSEGDYAAAARKVALTRSDEIRAILKTV